MKLNPFQDPWMWRELILFHCSVFGLSAFHWIFERHVQQEFTTTNRSTCSQTHHHTELLWDQWVSVSNDRVQRLEPEGCYLKYYLDYFIGVSEWHDRDSVSSVWGECWGVCKGISPTAPTSIHVSISFITINHCSLIPSLPPTNHHQSNNSFKIHFIDWILFLLLCHCSNEHVNSNDNNGM
mgnify:CR=1 FL=1